MGRPFFMRHPTHEQESGELFTKEVFAANPMIRYAGITKVHEPNIATTR